MNRPIQHAAVAATGLGISRSAYAAGSDTYKIVLIGCGGRGRGAAANALANTACPNVKLVALADAFSDPLELSLKALTARFPEKVDVPPERRFVGLHSFQEAMETDADVVLLCSPPGFRPQQFEAAVKADKHIFAEKPVATDIAGVKRFLKANQEAQEKDLLVAVGHHLRHETKHTESIAQIHDGAIGDLQYLRVFFNSPGVWTRPRKPEQTEMQHQVNNWYYFTWLSGDHIVEQHVHDLDVMNWIADEGHPVRANGMGGRQVRISPDHGEIFDHHFVEYTFPSGLKGFSQCRHIKGCWNSFSEHAVGAKGRVDMQGHGTVTMEVEGKDPVRWTRDHDGHQVEHDVLFDALKNGRVYNEGERGATATMTAILGRMATYTGNVVTWEDAWNSDQNLFPENLSWDADPGPKPGPDGIYPCAVPGVTKIDRSA